MDLKANTLRPEADPGRYRLLIDAITDYAIYMLDADGCVTSWNPGAERFKGYTFEEILGRHFSQFYTPEDQAIGLPARALKEAAEIGRFEHEGWRVRKDGTRFWAHVIIDPVRDVTGRLVGYAKVTRDLTERRAAEEALRRSEQQFRLLVQGVTDYAIYLLDPTGRVTSWNAGAERIKGYRSEEILGAHFSQFYTEEDKAEGAPARALATALSEGRFEKEGWRVRKGGERFLAHVIIDAIHDEQGEHVGFAKITRDITERVEAQRALDQAREALFQAQKLEAIGQLTGGIAHDFNNLLMAVIGSLELVRKRLPHDPRIMALIDNAMQGAQRGASLTQRMLAFARKQELQLQPVELPGLVRGMTGLLRRSIGPSIRIETRFPRGLALVRTDANQLESALLNLAVNARDAMQDGGVIRIEAVDATAEGDLPPGDYVRLSVRDTGEGMDAETAARATEPFYTTKGVGRGTGLGLSMVHGLAEQSGGRLIIRSEPGQGTEVAIWLPAVHEEEELHTFTGSLVEDEAEPADPLAILAVDDDNLVLMNTVAMLEDLGHRVFLTTTGHEALALLRRERVDLVITDYAMPHMNGVELAAAVKAEHPALPILLATGFAELPANVSAELPRLAKPFLQADLVRAIREVRAAAARPSASG